LKNLAPLTIGFLLAAIFSVLVLHDRAELKSEIHRTLIERDAAILRPVAWHQLALREATSTPDLLPAVLESADQENMLAVVIFDAEGHTVNFQPDTLQFTRLALDDYLRLMKQESISRYFPDFSGAGFLPNSTGISSATRPVLEVTIPLHGRDAKRLLGFARYFIDAQQLAQKLDEIDRRISGQAIATIGIGIALIALVITAGSFALVRAQRAVAERNRRLLRANVELALAAKASAVGQITSHLLHGLQNSLSGLKAVVADRGAPSAEDDAWKIAGGYATHMQEIIQETISLLGEVATQTTYELTGHDLVAIVAKRNEKSAAQKSLKLKVSGGFDVGLDSHRGGLLCLIINNLVANALVVSPAGSEVSVVFHRASEEVFVEVVDRGPGIPERIRAHLFEPGRSGRPGGTGLGLAISQLLARQIGASLTLEKTGPDGTVFRISLPLKAVTV
jgi:signal transduction histidine kinase